MTKPMVDQALWLRRYHESPEGAPRLVCFPHAGGAASFYLPVSSALRGEVEVLAVQYPGRQDRRTEPQVSSIESLADQVVEVLAPGRTGHTVLFGHSMGAVVAFEVARRLEQGTGPGCAALVLSGRRGPEERRPERVHLRDDDGIVAEMRALSGTAATVLGDEELMQVILPTIRSDYQAIETYEYQPGPKLTCPITVFIGDTDPQVTLDEARAWGRYTTGGFALRTFSGGHFYLTERQHEVLAGLAAVVRG